MNEPHKSRYELMVELYGAWRERDEALERVQALTDDERLEAAMAQGLVARAEKAEGIIEQAAQELRKQLGYNEETAPILAILAACENPPHGQTERTPQDEVGRVQAQPAGEQDRGGEVRGVRQDDRSSDGSQEQGTP
jgi:hypothetical protein